MCCAPILSHVSPFYGIRVIYDPRSYHHQFRIMSTIGEHSATGSHLPDGDDPVTGAIKTAPTPNHVIPVFPPASQAINVASIKTHIPVVLDLKTLNYTK